MPGILGIVANDNERGAAARDLARMLASVARSGQRQSTVDDANSGNFTFGWMGHAWHDERSHVATVEESTIVVNGELYHAALGGGKPDGPAGSADVNDAAARLLTGYLAHGKTFLAGLEGRFAAAIWDGRRRRGTLISDKFGSKPLYVYKHAGRLAFASDIKALLSLPAAPRNVNRTGLIQFFAFGHLWNQDTLWESVTCLQAATIAEFDPATGEFRQEPYWRPQAGARRDATASLEAIDAALKRAVDDRTVGVDGLGMSLSGGLDARTMLGVMDHPRTPTQCVSMGMEGSLDQRTSRRLAKLVACDYQSFVLDETFLADFDRHLADMVDLTGGQYLSQCIVMPTLPRYTQLGVRVLLRGHAGELMHMQKAYNFSMDAAAAQLHDEHALESWLCDRLQSHLLDGVDEPLITGVDRGSFAEAARQSLAAGLAATGHWNHPVDRVSQLFLDQRTRRETAMSLVKFDSIADARVPYLDGRVVEALFASPPELRLGERIQTHILRKRRPEFLAPPNSNTGAPVGAGRLRIAWSHFRLRVLAKLGVKGYQPYERLGLWLRRELRESVEGILLDAECLDRGVLHPDAVRGIVRRHLTGERNHTYLIMGMMAVEAGFRRSAAGDGGKSIGPPTPPATNRSLRSAAC